MRNTALLVTAIATALGGTSEKDAAPKSYWKRLGVASINPQARTMAVHDPGLEISWDGATRFLLHRSVRLKDLKQNTVIHVFGKLHASRRPGTSVGESLITDVAYIGTGDAYEQPPLTPGSQFIAWHTGALRSYRPPFYLKIGDVEYRLSVEEDAAAYSLEKIAPQTLAGKSIMVRGISERLPASTGGKPRPATRVLAREAHLLELNAKHAKVFQLQWAEERKTGTGLKGDYFDHMDLTGLKLSRTDATVGFDWGTGAPDPSLGSDNFSVRWTGQVKAPYTETVTFYTFTDDGVRLWVNNQLLIDKWVQQPSTEWTGSIALMAGQRYDIRMEYFDGTFNAVAKLLWSSPSIERQVIPQSQLSRRPWSPRWRRRRTSPPRSPRNTT